MKNEDKRLLFFSLCIAIGILAGGAIDRYLDKPLNFEQICCCDNKKEIK